MNDKIHHDDSFVLAYPVLATQQRNAENKCGAKVLCAKRQGIQKIRVRKKKKEAKQPLHPDCAPKFKINKHQHHQPKVRPLQQKRDYYPGIEEDSKF